MGKGWWLRMVDDLLFQSQMKHVFFFDYWVLEFRSLDPPVSLRRTIPQSQRVFCHHQKSSGWSWWVKQWTQRKIWSWCFCPTKKLAKNYLSMGIIIPNMVAMSKHIWNTNLLIIYEFPSCYWCLIPIFDWTILTKLKCFNLQVACFKKKTLFEWTKTKFKQHSQWFNGPVEYTWRFFGTADLDRKVRIIWLCQYCIPPKYTKKHVF